MNETSTNTKYLRKKISLDLANSRSKQHELYNRDHIADITWLIVSTISRPRGPIRLTILSDMNPPRMTPTLPPSSGIHDM